MKRRSDRAIERLVRRPASNRRDAGVYPSTMPAQSAIGTIATAVGTLARIPASWISAVDGICRLDLVVTEVCVPVVGCVSVRCDREQARIMQVPRDARMHVGGINATLPAQVVRLGDAQPFAALVAPAPRWPLGATVRDAVRAKFVAMIVVDMLTRRIPAVGALVRVEITVAAGVHRCHGEAHNRNRQPTRDANHGLPPGSVDVLARCGRGHEWRLNPAGAPQPPFSLVGSSGLSRHLSLPHGGSRALHRQGLQMPARARDRNDSRT
jgi:hypothetical protein